MSKMKFGYAIVTSDGKAEVVGPPVLRSALRDNKGARFQIVKAGEVMATGRFLGQGRDLGEVLLSIKATKGISIQSPALGHNFRAIQRGVIVAA